MWPPIRISAMPGIRARRRIAALLALLAFLELPEAGQAQEAAEEDSVQAKSATLIPFPFYMYSPETKSGGGIVVNYFRTPRGSRQENKPSTYSASFIFTQRSQIAVGLGIDRYWDHTRNQLQGGVEFSRFPDTFYGVGNDTDEDVSEDFTPRTIAISAGLRREIAPDVRVGPQVTYVHQEIREVEDDGILARGELPGSKGGTLVQLGLSASRDHRDHIVYPRAGSFEEVRFNISEDALGSDFSFTAFDFDVRRYASLSKSQVIAVRGLVTFTTGTPPFQTLAMLGGDRVMRGYYAGRFRDRHRYALQAEYRLGFWRRMGVAAFADVGDVARRVSDLRLDEVRFAVGAGLRFLLSRSEGVTLRADIGNGDDGSGGVYLAILEAY